MARAWRWISTSLSCWAMRADSPSAVVARASRAAFSARCFSSAAAAAFTSWALSISLMAWEASWAAARAWSAMRLLFDLAARALAYAALAPSTAWGLTWAALSFSAISMALAAWRTAAGVSSLYWNMAMDSRAGLASAEKFLNPKGVYWTPGDVVWPEVKMT